MDDRLKLVLEIFKKHKWIVIAGVCLVLLLLSFTKTGEVRNTPATYTKTTEDIDTQKVQQENEIINISPEEMRQTIVGDSVFNNNVQIFYTKYPWYKKIPIETEKYFIVYDFEKTSFRIRFKGGVDVNDAEVLKSALEDIRKIGADPTRYYTQNP